MTQKELLYYEDAYGHESSIIKLIDNAIKTLSNPELVTFMEEEKKKHEDLKHCLINVLEEIANG